MVHTLSRAMVQCTHNHTVSHHATAPQRTSARLHRVSLILPFPAQWPPRSNVADGQGNSGTVFPYFDGCNADSKSSQWRVAVNPVVMATPISTTYCMNVTVLATCTKPGDPCCTPTLQKFMLDAGALLGS